MKGRDMGGFLLLDHPSKHPGFGFAPTTPTSLRVVLNLPLSAGVVPWLWLQQEKANHPRSFPFYQIGLELQGTLSTEKITLLQSFFLGL